MRRKSARLGLPCPTHMLIHCCRVSLRYSWLMGCARVRRAGWNSTTDSGRYLNQLLSFKSSSSTPPLPAITVRDQPSTGHPPACTPGQLQGSGLTCRVLARGALQGGEEQPTGQGWVWGHPLRHGVEESVGLVQRGGEQLHQGTHLSFDSCTCTEVTVSQGSPSAQVGGTATASGPFREGKGLSLTPHLLPHYRWAENCEFLCYFGFYHHEIDGNHPSLEEEKGRLTPTLPRSSPVGGTDRGVAG